MLETTQNGIVLMSLRLITWLEQRWNWITLGARTTCVVRDHTRGYTLVARRTCCMACEPLCSGVTGGTEETDMRTF